MEWIEQSSTSMDGKLCGCRACTRGAGLGCRRCWRRQHEESGYEWEFWEGVVRCLAEVPELEGRGTDRLVYSVSTGHGAIPGLGPHQYGAIPYESQWHQVVLGYLNSKFPGGTTFSNGAKAAVDSTFFEWCWSSLMYVCVARFCSRDRADKPAEQWNRA